MNLKKVLLVLLISAFVCNDIKADDGDDYSNFSFGALAGVNINTHIANFEGFSGIPSYSPGYKSGVGMGIYGGLFTSYKLNDNSSLFLRAYFNDESAKLTKLEDEQMVYYPSQDRVGPGEFEHSQDATIQTLSFMPGYSLNFSDLISFNFGVRIGMKMKAEFIQKEEILNAEGVFVETGSKVRGEYEGEIPGASSLIIAPAFGLNFQLPMNSDRTLWLQPDIILSYAVNSYSSDVTWNNFQTSLGAAIRYNPKKPLPPPIPPINPPFIAPEAPEPEKIQADIIAYSINDDGKESEVSILKIEELISRNQYPLLSYVFFDKNSSEIPGKYQKISKSETQDYEINKPRHKNPVVVSREILNIIGLRLSSDNKMKITIIGCNDNTDEERRNTKLSKARAESIRDYLNSIWGIDNSRMTIKARNLPEKESNTTTEDGQSENRRVEILANNKDLLVPIIIQDTARTYYPPSINFKSNYDIPSGIKDWKLTVIQNSKVIKSFEGNNTIPGKIDWNLSEDKESLDKIDFRQELKYKLHISDNDNQEFTSELKQLKLKEVKLSQIVRENVQDKEIDRFSLILFDFNSSKIDRDNLDIINNAKKKIEASSTVYVYGYADRSGMAEANLKLSQKRADAVAKQLKLQQENSIGKGNTVLLYDNDTPEGRFYNRTVIIEIINFKK